jgi:hypothetical protein
MYRAVPFRLYESWCKKIMSVHVLYFKLKLKYIKDIIFFKKEKFTFIKDFIKKERKFHEGKNSLHFGINPRLYIKHYKRKCLNKEKRFYY